MKILTLNFAICVFLNYVQAYNILGVFPHPGRSHFDSFAPLFKELAKRGHNVTVISHYPQTEKINNYRDVSLSGSAQKLVNIVNVNEIPKNEYVKHIMAPFMLMNLGQNVCNTLGAPVIQEFLKEDHQFDLVINENFNENCFMGLVYKMKAPYIGFSTCTIMPWTPQFYGIPDNPSYIPDNLIGVSDRISFFGRVYNTWSQILHIWFVEPLMGNYMNENIVRKHLGDDIPPLKEIARNSSLFLVNTHYSLNRPRPLPPNVVEVGGIHILNSTNKLPKDIKKYLDEATNGVIYFSMGSMIKGASFPEEKRQAFLKAFAELPQRVLWKYENDTLPGKLNNVKIGKWLPQVDILNHPNVVAFISHGGLLGTIEATHAGVPIVSIPIYGDQFTNVRAIVATGGGVYLNWNDISKETVLEKLREVLQPSFRERSKTVSKIYRDRLQSPMETAIYWVEYVARHKGAYFMRSAAVDLSLYQYLLLDVIAFTLLLMLLTTYVFLKLISLVRSKKDTGGSEKLKDN